MKAKSLVVCLGFLVSNFIFNCMSANSVKIEDLFAERVGGKNYGNAQFKMGRITAAKAAASEKNPDLDFLDFGVGEPDGAPMPRVVEELHQAALSPKNHGYAYNGPNAFKEAVASYMDNVFGVELDPKNEIVHCIGTKGALAMLPALFINEGDYLIATSPSYPILPLHVKYYGGKVYEIPIGEENNFLPDLDSVPREVLHKAKMLLLTYPNNPTGAVANKAFFEKAIAWGKKHNILIINDAAYATLIFEGQPLSIMQIPGAKDIAVELHSMSKAFNMAGWRIGWVCGNPTVVKVFSSVKNSTDSGQFLPIQSAAIKALENPNFTKSLAVKYKRRAGKLVSVLQRKGFDVGMPKAAMFLYTKAPKGVRFKGEEKTFSSAEEFSLWLINEHHVATVPWDENGAYIRFSLGFKVSESDEIALVRELEKRLTGYEFVF